MKNSRKIAVIKKNKDIARIVVYNFNDSKYEVKLSIFINEFNVLAFESFKKHPRLFEYKENNAEITFHIAKEELNSVIHLKSNNGEYIRLIEKNLIDFHTSIYLPIPLLKIYLPKELEGIKNYKFKKNHEVI